MNSPEGFNEDDKCRVVPLETEKARYLGSRIAIANDLAFVLATCRLMIEHIETVSEGEKEDSPLQQALWTSILIAYERCFSSGKRVSLQHSDLNAIDPSGGALALHKYYAAMRDKHLAHSVNPFATVKIGAALASKSSGRREVDGIAVMAIRHVAGTEEEVRQLGSLVSSLHSNVEAECEHLMDNEVLSEARALDIEDMYSREEMHFVVPDPEAANTGRR